MNWRLIEQNEYNAAMNMAIDHVIYESVASGKENPTIRFYKWASNSVSIGAYQNSKEINLEACKNHNVQIVRRMTGGRAVFHDKADFTYSIAAPIRFFKYRIENAYREICSCIINALNDFGIKAVLENKNDILVDNKKISGNAARLMDKGIYLQHGTLIYDIDHEVMPKILNISSDLINDRATSILQNKKMSQKEVYNALKNNFIANKHFKVGELSNYEIMRAKDLAKTRYSTIMLPSGTLIRNKGACYVERGG